jgi:hypothetical protein
MKGMEQEETNMKVAGNNRAEGLKAQENVGMSDMVWPCRERDGSLLRKLQNGTNFNVVNDVLPERLLLTYIDG